MDVAFWRRGQLCCRGWSPGFHHTATPETRSLNTQEDKYVFPNSFQGHTLLRVRVRRLNGRTCTPAREVPMPFWVTLPESFCLFPTVSYCIHSRARGRDKCCFFITLSSNWGLLCTVWFSPLSTDHKHIPITSVIIWDQLAPGWLDVISFPFITFLNRKPGCESTSAWKTLLVWHFEILKQNDLVDELYKDWFITDVTKAGTMKDLNWL